MNKSLFAKNPFLIRVRYLEEKLFANDLDPADSTRMRSEKYSWLYRPSHHVASGLITVRDVEQLKGGKTLLSVGANPAFLERVLLELGVPAESITLADKDPSLTENAGSMKHVLFDMTEPWPDIGNFDRILFPESLCISLSNKIEQELPQKEGLYPNDKRESELLAFVLGQALSHLHPHGEIRANGPQSHPNVVRRASSELHRQGHPHALHYQRYLLTVRAKEGESTVQL